MNMVRRLLNAVQAPQPFDEEKCAYKRLKDRGFWPGAIIDVGAYEGQWTKAALSIWPNTPTLMIEPQEAKKPMLEAICAEFPCVQYRSALVSSSKGEAVTFYEMETGSSLYAERSNAARTQTQHISTTLDAIAKDDLVENIFLKVDVQGAEMDVLIGGAETLRRATAVQLELPLVRYNEGAPKFLEMLQFMDQRDFVPMDISNKTIIRGIMVQVDVIFVSNYSILRDDHFYF